MRDVDAHLEAPDDRGREDAYRDAASGPYRPRSNGPEDGRLRATDAERKLVARARRTLGGKEDQDACQEVWIRVWAKIENFRGESAFATWLYAIAVNTCLNIRQKDARREEREHRGEMPDLSEPRGKEADPEAAALNSERRGELQSALRNVREDHRAALVLKHVEGYTYAEVAEILGVPDGTVKG